MTYELWNRQTGNAIGEFATEAEALALVREAIARNGPGYADMLALGRTSRGRSKAVAEGRALADRALAVDSRVTVPA